MAKPDQGYASVKFAWKIRRLLWFTFFHEGASVIKHGREKDVFIEGPVQTKDEDMCSEKREKRTRLLVISRFPSPLSRNLRERGIFSAAAVEGFASQNCDSPGVVVGRVQVASETDSVATSSTD